MEKVNKIQRNLQPTEIDPHVSYQQLVQGKNLTDKFNIKKISMAQLKGIIKLMKSKRSSGNDGISMRLIKEYFPSVGRSVIQGSVDSCILYTIFTADLPLAVHQHQLSSAINEEDCLSPKITTYVDDVLALTSDKNIELRNLKIH